MTLHLREQFFYEQNINFKIANHLPLPLYRYSVPSSTAYLVLLLILVYFIWSCCPSLYLITSGVVMFCHH